MAGKHRILLSIIALTLVALTSSTVVFAVHNYLERSAGDTSANKIDAVWNGTTVHLFLAGDADQNGVINALDVSRAEKIIVRL